MKENQIKLLTIDDDPGLRRAIRIYFEDQGYEVFESEDGASGLESFDQNHPDVVLIDLRMPGISGLELTTMLNKKAPYIPLVIVSGAGNVDEVIETMRKGAWDYVTKPIGDMDILNHVVSKVLERADLIKENQKYQDILEDLVKDRTKELAQVTQKYKEIFNTTSEAIIIHDVQTGEILDVNQTMLDMFGYSYEMALALSILDLSSGEVENTQKKALAQIKKAVTQGTQAFEWNCKRQSGEFFWAEVTLKKTDILGRNRVIAVVRDITSRKLVEKENILLERQLKQTQKMEAVGLLAGGIAHDFNNILSVIFGHVDLIIDKFSKEGDTYFSLNHIQNAANRAKELVSQILAFSRKTDEEYFSVNPEIIVSEALKLIRSTIPATIQIKKQINKNCGQIMANPVQIHQIVMNLCTNAYHAMREKGGDLNVKLEPFLIVNQGKMFDHLATKQKEFLKLTITDTGTGIEKDVIDKIFDPYFTTKIVGEGTGLGLSVVHGIIKHMGGEIFVKSRIGEGTKFEVYIPQLLNAQIQDEKKSLTQDNDTGGTERILLLDDDVDIAEIGSKILSRYGYKVTTFSDGNKAFSKFNESPDDYDLVITDMTMPGMTGEQFARKCIQVKPQIPIILCTGFSDLIDEEKAYQVGIRKFIMKPFLKSDFIKSVRDVLDE